MIKAALKSSQGSTVTESRLPWPRIWRPGSLCVVFDILGLNSRTTIANYEQNDREPDFEIVKIAKYFGVSIDYLLGLTDKR